MTPTENEMQTFPENSHPDKKAPLAMYIYGNRFHADQTLPEYLIEFLLVFCAEKDAGDDSDGKFHFHDPSSTEPLSYTVEPRMGLKRFIFFDKSKKNDVAEVDRIAYQELITALSKKIDGSSDEEAMDLIESLQDLFHGYAVVLRKRAWCAQAMLPICPEVVFCEAMPKKKERSKLEWTDAISGDDKKIDTLFDFNKRNFLARGGELYYLHILQGMQGQPEKRKKLEHLLSNLICTQGRKMSKIANFIQQTWEEEMGYKQSPKQNLKLAYIPESAYKNIASLSVDELINYLSCGMHPIKKIELLSKGVMVQVLRMLSVATTNYLGKERSYWIIDMKGMTEKTIRKIASSGFKKVEEEFSSALGKKSIDLDMDSNIDFRMKEVRKAKKDSLDIFRSKGKELQCIIPISGAYERFSLSEDCIRFLVLALVGPGEKMTLDMFLQRLFDQYRIVIGPTEYRKTVSEGYDISLANSFYENKIAFQDFLMATGFLHELSDATSIVVNPYESISTEEETL